MAPAGMKIQITIEGKNHTGKLPYDGADHVDVTGAKCPHCGDAAAVLDDTGRVASLARPGGLAAAMKECPGGRVVEAPDHLSVRMVTRCETFDGWDGIGVCTRCQRTVGEMTVRVSTLFGVAEDRAVLHGRARVY